MSQNGSRTWFAVFVLVVFCTGAGAGMLAARFLVFPPPPGEGGGPRGGPRGGGRGPGPLAPKEAVDRLLDDLRLSPDQRAKFDQLMSDHRARLEAFYQDVQTRFETEQRDLRTAIRESFTPDQQQRFDAWLKRQPPPPPGFFGGRPGQRGGPAPEPRGRR